MKKTKMTAVMMAMATMSAAGLAPSAEAAFQGTSKMNDPVTGSVLLTETGNETTRTANVDGHGNASFVSASNESYASGTGASVTSDAPSERIAAFDTAIGHKAAVTGSADTAVGAGATVNSMYGGTAIGAEASAKGGQMVTSVGFMANASGNFSTAIGANASASENGVAIGPSSVASAVNSVALGKGSIAKEANTVSVGSEKETRRITNVTAGTKDTDAVNVSQLNKGLAGKADVTLNNINEAGKKVIIDLAKTVDSNAVVKAGDSNINVTSTKNGNVTTYSMKLADEINAKSYGVDGKVYINGKGINANSQQIKNVADATDGKDAVNLDQLNKAISEVEVKGGTDKNAVHYDGEDKDIVTLQGKDGTTITNLKDGKVSEDSKDAVNGGQLYAEKTAREKADKDLDNRIDNEAAERKAADEELGSLIDKETSERKAADEALSERIGYVTPGKDYNAIDASKSVSQNLESLDKAIIVKDNGREITVAPDSETKVINMAGKDGETRTITGIKTNDGDKTSAVSVGYLDDQLDDMKSDISAVGAGAAALAGLHPMDFDEHDKFSYAASVGTYDGEVAGAVGAFYQPTSKFMVSVGGTVTNTKPMVNVGIAGKLGPKGEQKVNASDLEKQVQELTNTVNNLQNQLKDIKCGHNEDLKWNSSHFIDVPNDHWAKDAVEKLSKYGIVIGYGDDTFRGDSKATRYEVAQIIARTMDTEDKIHEAGLPNKADAADNSDAQPAGNRAE